uniref:Uncharacterized protein n=1 Tax=Caenorhabditis japonica TaxID=281687 RepID=A0A8R1HK06_CAEJA
MSNGFWMVDDVGGGQTTNGGWNTNTQAPPQQDMGWGQFDYTQPQQPQQPQQSAGNDYYQQNFQQFQQQPQTNYNANYGGQMFMPNGAAAAAPNNQADGEDYENEPPLLEELGINFSHIKEKTIAVLNPTGVATVEDGVKIVKIESTLGIRIIDAVNKFESALVSVLVAGLDSDEFSYNSLYRIFRFPEMATTHFGMNF